MASSPLAVVGQRPLWVTALGGLALFCYQLSEMRSISDSKKSRGRPKTGIGPAIGLRLYPDLEKKLDAWIRRQPDKPSQPEAIRRLIEEALALPAEVTTHVDHFAEQRDMSRSEAVRYLVEQALKSHSQANMRRRK
jgi:hypothetical protein